MTLSDGVRYKSWPLGTPAEQARRISSYPTQDIEEWHPLPVFDNLGRHYPSGPACWYSLMYTRLRREPFSHTMASFVADVYCPEAPRVPESILSPGGLIPLTDEEQLKRRDRYSKKSAASMKREMKNWAAASPTPRARAERPPRSNDALSELPGDLSSKVKAIIGQQMSILEAKLRKEMAVPVAPKDDARTKAQRLEEKLLQQFHRVKEEGQRLRPSKEVLGGEDPMPLAPEESEAAISEEGSVPSMPEAPSLPSTRKLTEELQMQMARVERRLEQLEEDVRRLGRREDHDERPRGAVGPVLGGPVPSTAPEVQATLDRRMDGMQEMLRSLEDGLRSWQSHTQRLEDLWHRGRPSRAHIAQRTQEVCQWRGVTPLKSRLRGWLFSAAARSAALLSGRAVRNAPKVSHAKAHS
eukprot:g18471.t1